MTIRDLFSHRRLAGLVIATAVLVSPAAVAAQTQASGIADAVTRATVARGLVPHRAVIDLKLVKSTNASSVSGLTGRMVFEVNGSACEGFTVNFRFVTRLRDTQGQTRVTDLRTTTFEGGEAERFDFVTQTFVNDKMSEETRGSVERGDDDVAALLTLPERKQFDLPGSIVFPTQHLVEMVYGAKTGAGFVSADLYDGSEGGEKVFPTAMAIGPAMTKAEDFKSEPAADVPGLKGVKHWPVSVGYYNGAIGMSGEQTPVYEMRFVLYENGVSRKLEIDYGDFVLEGTVTELTILDMPKCE